MKATKSTPVMMRFSPKEMQQLTRRSADLQIKLRKPMSLQAYIRYELFKPTT